MTFFFFNDTATTEIYTLSLHDALPIFPEAADGGELLRVQAGAADERAIDVRLGHDRGDVRRLHGADRKSTRLNSSHANISYAVFCLKKNKKYNHSLYVYTIRTLNISLT